MIPDEYQAKALWERYHLPQDKQIHVALVARVARFFVREMQKKISGVSINERLVFAAGLLHDIDKAIAKKEGERHPDTAVRVLREEDMSEVADLVATHPLHSILDPAIAPKSWEEKLLYLADKMVKYEIITVDKRFALWNAESLPSDAQAILDAAYPKVKALEKEVFSHIGITQNDVAMLA